MPENLKPGGLASKQEIRFHITDVPNKNITNDVKMAMKIYPTETDARKETNKSTISATNLLLVKFCNIQATATTDLEDLSLPADFYQENLLTFDFEFSGAMQTFIQGKVIRFTVSSSNISTINNDDFFVSVVENTNRELAKSSNTILQNVQTTVNTIAAKSEDGGFVRVAENA